MLMFCCVVVAAYYSYEDAEVFYQIGHVDQAREIFGQLASRGDDRAQYRLGGFYRDGGANVPQDMRQACDWFEQAANKGHQQATLELGHCYWQGEGREQNIDAALLLYEVLAGNGLPEAQERLARIYAAGSGVRRDPQRAYIYLFLAVGGDLAQQPDLAESIRAELDEKQLQRAQELALRQLKQQTARQQR